MADWESSTQRKAVEPTPMEDIAAAFDDIAYLSGSPTRVEVLQYLMYESLTRSELEDRCGASRVTLGRVLTSLEERGWITRDRHEVRATVLGEIVGSGFLTLCRTIDSALKLDRIAVWLPSSLDLDLLALADADVTFSTRADPFAPVVEFFAASPETTENRVITPLVTPEAIERSWDAVVNHDQQLSMVLTEDVLEVIRSSPPLGEKFAELLHQEAVDARITEKEVPYLLAIGDGRTHLGLVDDGGLPRALLTSTNPKALDWCVRQFNTYWNEAKPIANGVSQ